MGRLPAIMAKEQHLYVTSREAWRAWLQQHHGRPGPLWLIFYKKAGGRPSLDYNAAVEEAICFGWIDSIIKRLDGERYLRKFTPRRPGSHWSRVNRARARRMVRQGRMTSAGLAILGDALERQEQDKTEKRALPIPADLKAALKEKSAAWRNFSAFAPSYQQRYLGWIHAAKRPDTRERRIREVARLAAQNIKSVMK